MQADVGDRLVERAHRLGGHDRDGEILEVHGVDGAPPYLVRWTDDGPVGLVFPGSDALVERFADATRAPDGVGPVEATVQG
jgi:Domain of unknown function (DUF1918)